MKHILVPFDFSAPAIEALKFATELAKREDTDISMIHAVEFPAMINSSVALEYEREYMALHRTRAIKRMNKIAQRLAKGIKVNTLIDFGGVVPAVERAATYSKADLIVMGTHGASGWKEITIGSNAEKVVRRSKVPVIAIRKSVKSIRNIIFPFAQGTIDQKEIIESVKKLQLLFNAELHVVFINTPSAFGRDTKVRPAMEAFVDRYHLKNCSLDIFNDINEAEGIINYTSNFKDPMVAMGTHGRKGIKHLSMGSVTEDVLNHILCPISTFRIAGKS